MSILNANSTLDKIIQAVENFRRDYNKSPQIIVAWDGYYMSSRIYEYEGIKIIWSPNAQHIYAY